MDTNLVLTPNLLVSAITVIALLATMVEIVLEALKPVFTRIAAEDLRKSAYILSSAIIGIGLAFLFNFNLLTFLPVLVIPTWAGPVAMGVLSTGGSRFWHTLLELLIKLSAKLEQPVSGVTKTP